MIQDDVELELWLTWRAPRTYGVTARVTRSDKDQDFRVTEPSVVAIDPAELRALEADPGAYGARLTELVFTGDVRGAFGEARAAAEQLGRALRVRLFIGTDARDLQQLRWELLHDPRTGAPLLTAEDLLFSRYLSSSDWRPVRMREKGQLKALVVVANPSDLATYAPGGRALAPIDVPGELARARESLGADVAVEELATPGAATIDAIAARLRSGVDVLYLVCHGAFVEGKPRLWLEDEKGATARVSGTDLVDRIQDAAERPRLVVLASCDSGTGTLADDGTLAALGPRLAQGGVSAVLAMNGKASMKSTAAFMPAFFEELLRDGRIDRAVAVARGRIRDAPDFHMPVLFMRLRSGRLWYDQGGGEPGEFERWHALLADIDEACCVPILGPGLTETVVGSLRDVARRWAQQYDFPLAPQSREDLAQVAQYLAYWQRPPFPRQQLREYLKKHIADQFKDRLSPDLLQQQLAPGEPLTVDALVSAAGKVVREGRAGADVHARLARLPFKLYVTANRDNLLRDALREAKKDPQVVLVRWKDWEEPPPSIFEKDPEFRPSVQRPVILHLFGNLEWPETLVLTEDDFFDFLLGIARSQQGGRRSVASPAGAALGVGERPAIPQWVASKVAASGLLFLGFQIDDWEFRILYRAIVMQEGSALGAEHPRIAVQLNPSEGRILEPVRARRYLERYFQKGGTSYEIFWGAVDGFMKALEERRGNR